MSKFPIIFFSVWIILQFLSWNVARGLAWQFNLQKKWLKRLILLILLLTTNGLMLAAYLRVAREIFRINAIFMASLWFVFLATVAVWVLGKILRCLKVQNIAHYQRWFAPFAVAGVFGLAVYNAYVPVVKHVSIQIDKPLAKPVRVGMAADTHLGVLVGARQLNKLADIFNSEKVDIILLPGDIMDDNTIAYEAENMKPHLQKIRAPLGVYATLGNHDLFGNEKSIAQAIKDAGMIVLHDNAVLVEKRFWVVGRPDQLDKNRAKTQTLLQKENVDTTLPVFLLDHRPDDVEAHSHLPIDLQVSGHVHNGQVFPGNIVVRFLNRLHYGYEKMNQMHAVVTSGYGFWGIPFRLGSQAEVWIIDVQGKK